MSATEIPEPQVWLDERGRPCPLPVIAMAKAAKSAHGSPVIAVLADDPGARYDIPAWCRMIGATYLGEISVPDDKGGSAYVVQISESAQTDASKSIG